MLVFDASLVKLESQSLKRSDHCIYDLIYFDSLIDVRVLGLMILALWGATHSQTQKLVQPFISVQEPKAAFCSFSLQLMARWESVPCFSDRLCQSDTSKSRTVCIGNDRQPSFPIRSFQNHTWQPGFFTWDCFVCQFLIRIKSLSIAAPQPTKGWTVGRTEGALQVFFYTAPLKGGQAHRAGWPYWKRMQTVSECLECKTVLVKPDLGRSDLHLCCTSGQKYHLNTA